jgi:hypothetical protein
MISLRKFFSVLFKSLLISVISFLFSFNIFSQVTNDDCLMCHDDKELQGTINGKTVSLYVNPKILEASIHKSNNCIDCHQNYNPEEFPHNDANNKPQCTPCHNEEVDLYKECLHGKAKAKGDRLAPTCEFCHGTHNILAINNPRATTYPTNIPFLCGRCHKENSPVQLYRNIPQDRILENYRESIHGEGLLKKGLIVSANCASCHSAHRILPHTDSRSSIARGNIAKTCAKCHAGIENVHLKVIQGQLWEKEEHVLPACVDCHQPHIIRNVFYAQAFANEQCLKCHDNPNLKSSVDGHSLFVDAKKLEASSHQKINCGQCHVINNPFKHRPCENLQQKVDCASCHAEVGTEYNKSIHGVLFAQNDPDAPSCKECHGTHEVLGHLNPKSPIFSIRIPKLCANCHRAGEKSAVRSATTEDVISHYTESIHGKGLLKSGLTVTATCTDCHSKHFILPKKESESSVNHAKIAQTCGKCHNGIEEQFDKSIHSPLVSKTNKVLPVCSTCHSAHEIRRADTEGFKLEIMRTCGNCHEKIAETYFDTYHGKVSQLGYTKTAKCYDCHGAHDILPPSNPVSHLSRQNVLATCQKCHLSANKQFAGYFTHATHHDPEKYPILFWTFWGMTGLLLFTFFLAGLHTILWLPRSIQWRKELAEKIKLAEADSEDKPVK